MNSDRISPRPVVGLPQVQGCPSLQPQVQAGEQGQDLPRFAFVVGATAAVETTHTSRDSRTSAQAGGACGGLGA